jgi:hypothetical protein
MKQNANKLLSILGWLLFLVAIGLFIIQMGYLLLHDRFQMEYIDNRLFYIINLSIVICLYGAIMILFNFKRRFKAIAAGFTGVFIVMNLFLLFQSNKEIKNIISISPDANNVFSVKKTQQDETIYYRSYYGILARPKATLPYPITGDYHVEWLANDVAVFTYQTNDNKVQTFVGTYGDRKPGGSYYYVGMEMQGVWQDGNMKVISKPDGIHVMENRHEEFFEWANVHQFGTLAIVLERDHQAIWTITLNEDFEVHSDASGAPTGSISLYKATIERGESYNLKYITSN